MFGIKKLARSVDRLRRTLHDDLHRLRLSRNSRLAQIEMSIDELTNEVKRAQGKFVDADFGSTDIDRVGRLDPEIGEKVQELVKESVNAPENSHVVAVTPEQVYLADEPE